MSDRRVMRLLVGATTSVLALSGAALLGPGQSAAGAITGPRADTATETGIGSASRSVAVQSERARADDVFYNHVLPSSRVAVRWSGSVSGCRAGAISSAARAAALDVVNSYRRLARQRAVRFTDTLNARAQRAALMMQAAGALSHAPGRSWPCYSRAGALGASRSNLALRVPGLWALSAYARDSGSGNRSVGHRRWLLDPRQTRMGIGQAGRANALYVLDTGSWAWPTSAPTYVTWPAAGYFPVGLEPGGRWSFASERSSINLAGARVVMSGPEGRLPISVHTERDVVSWDLSRRLPRWASADRTYRVTVSGIRRSGAVVAPVSYRVTLVPLRRLRATTAPTVDGGGTRATVGSTLSAWPGRWTPGSSVGRYAYQWLRDGAPISGATGPSYTLTQADKGRTVTVRVSALPRDSYYRPGSATSSG